MTDLLGYECFLFNGPLINRCKGAQVTSGDTESVYQSLGPYSFQCGPACKDIIGLRDTHELQGVGQ